MITCKKCGEANEDGSMFCFLCGSPLFEDGQHPPVQPFSSQQTPGGPSSLPPDRAFIPPSYAPPVGAPPVYHNRFLHFLKRRWYIPALILIVIVAGILSFNTVVMMISPQLALKFAAAHTMAALNKQSNDSPLELFTVMGNSITSGKMGTQFSYQDENGNAADGDVSFLFDSASKNFGTQINLNIDKQPMAYEFYLNQKRLAFKATQTGDSYYGVTFDSYEKDLGTFTSANGLDKDALQTVTDMVNSVNTLMNTDNSKYQKEYKAILDAFVKKLTPVTSREKIETGGSTITCRVVTYELTEAAVEKLIGDLLAVYKESYQATAESSATLQNILTGLMSGISGSAGLDLQSANPLDMIDQALAQFNSFYQGSIYVSCYVKGNTLVRCDMTVPVDASSGQKAIITADFGRNPGRDTFTLTVDTSDHPVGGPVFTLTAKTDNNAVSNTTIISMSAENETYVIKMDWAKKSGDLQLSMNGPGINWKTSGSLTLDKDRFNLTFGDLLDESSHLKLTISAERGLPVPSPNYINLDRWDADLLSKLSIL